MNLFVVKIWLHSVSRIRVVFGIYLDALVHFKFHQTLDLKYKASVMLPAEIIEKVKKLTCPYGFEAHAFKVCMSFAYEYWLSLSFTILINYFINFTMSDISNLSLKQAIVLQIRLKLFIQLCINNVRRNSIIYHFK